MDDFTFNMKVYILESPKEKKGYVSFSRLCRENNLDRNKIKKEMLPVKVASFVIYSLDIDERL